MRKQSDSQWLQSRTWLLSSQGPSSHHLTSTHPSISRSSQTNFLVSHSPVISIPHLSPAYSATSASLQPEHRAVQRTLTSLRGQGKSRRNPLPLSCSQLQTFIAPLLLNQVSQALGSSLTAMPFAARLLANLPFYYTINVQSERLWGTSIWMENELI